VAAAAFAGPVIELMQLAEMTDDGIDRMKR
jgi:hypothetical protein